MNFFRHQSWIKFSQHHACAALTKVMIKLLLLPRHDLNSNLNEINNFITIQNVDKQVSFTFTGFTNFSGSKFACRQLVMERSWFIFYLPNLYSSSNGTFFRLGLRFGLNFKFICNSLQLPKTQPYTMQQ